MLPLAMQGTGQRAGRSQDRLTSEPCSEQPCWKNRAEDSQNQANLEPRNQRHGTDCTESLSEGSGARRIGLSPGSPHRSRQKHDDLQTAAPEILDPTL